MLKEADANGIDSPNFNKRPFSEEETVRIQKALDTPIDHEYIQFRPLAQGSVAYVEGWKALSLANEVFGFNGWSSEILSISTDFADVIDGKVSIGISCMVRVYLRDGYGSADNQKSRAAAYEKARKEAVTDAMKRALRVFGNRLGNCAYDKSYLRQVRSGARPTSRQVNPVNLSHAAAPIDFVPVWKHPKTAISITAPNPNVLSEADSEPVVTEEQLLEFGSFFTEKIDYTEEHHGTRSKATPLSHRGSGSRGEFRTKGGLSIATVMLPADQFRPPKA